MKASIIVQKNMSELRRLKGLLPPELQSWVAVETNTAVDPPLVTSEELSKDEVEIQITPCLMLIRAWAALSKP